MVLIQIVDPISKFLGDWAGDITIGSVILRLFLAIGLSFLIGIERSTRNHAAGVRTYVLVTVGSCIAMLTNQFIFETFGSGDASRLGAQVISGIGFLGAGAIMVTSRSQIKGLTTAAGMWACACMGLSCGVGFYTLAIIGAVTIFLVLTVLQSTESYFKDRSKNFSIHIELKKHEYLKDLLEYIRKQGIVVVRVELNDAYESSGLAVYSIYLLNKNVGNQNLLHIPIISAISDLDYVNYVEEI